MAVFRVERNKGYTVMSNHHLRNKELSLKAKGLLSQMLSLPEDWDYTLAGLSFINREKIDAIREAIKELERAGYIVRSRERDEKGRLRGTDYVIFEQPQTPPVSDLPTLENPTLDNPTLEKPMLENPTLENPTQLNKDISRTDLSKKEKSNTRSMSFDMREIDNRRFMFSPQAGELILGRQYRGGQLYKSHAEEHFDSGAKAPFDSFIRGWIGTGRDYPDGVIHFAPNIGTDNITAFDNAFSTLQMFSENGAAGDTVVRGFGRKWEQPLKDIITPTKERSKTVSEQEKNYSSYDFDRLEVAKKLVIERSIYFESEKADISALTGLPLAELARLRQESAAAEQAVFDRLKTEAAAWEQQAGNTRFLEKAIEYVQTPPGKHTSNKWEKTDYEWQLRSNAVYQMRYHVYENTRYDRQAQKSVPYSWSLTWSVRTNGPNHEQNVKIAGQERKTFSDKAAMEKYIAGRIKAYDRLFTEPAPPVPKEYAEPFKVNGLLLPGYAIEGEPPQYTAPQQAAQPTRLDPEKIEMDAAAMQAAPLTVEPPQPQPVIPINLTAEKPAEKLKEITDRLEQGITELFDSERYKEYLRVMSKFHNYSFNNTLLIAMQKPDASLIAGFNSWKNQFQRNVKKGEKGIKIIAPSPFKIKQETEKIDPQTQKPVIGRDGKPVTEEKEITIPAYKVVSVFDVSQTEGKELPDIAVDALTGDVEQYSDFFAALEKTSPVPIGFEKIEGGAHGYYHLEDKRIALDEGMSELQTLKTAMIYPSIAIFRRYAAMFRVGISFIFSRIKSRSASVTRNFSCTVLFRPSML